MHYPGSVADIEIFRQNKIFHEEASKKCVRDLPYNDEGLLDGHRDDFWAILADKGYQGAAEVLRVVHPIRVPLRGQLTPSQVEFNRKVCSDRIVVENFFGRMSSLWTVLSHKYRWNEGLYDDLFRMCLALTNCHVKNNPLRQADTVYFAGVRNRLRFVSNEQMEKRRAYQERSARLRRERMNGIVRRSLFDESDSE